MSTPKTPALSRHVSLAIVLLAATLHPLLSAPERHRNASYAIRVVLTTEKVDELVRILDRGGQHILGAHSDHVADDGTFLERSREDLRNDLYISFLERSAERSRNFPPSLRFSLGRESHSQSLVVIGGFPDELCTLQKCWVAAP